MIKPKSTVVLILAAFFSLGMGPRPKPQPADTTPPQVSITNPANNATVSGTVNIQTIATDNVGVTKVEFYVDNTLKSTDTASPYAYSWDTSATTNAGHALKVVAYDAKNNSKQAQINVSVNNAVVPSPAPPPPSPPTPPPASGSELTIPYATASSSNKSYPAARAIDKNFSTYWQGYWSFFSRPTSWWLVFDLGKIYSLTKISIFWNNVYGSTNYSIQGSSDNKTWINLQAGLSSAGGKANPYQKDHGLAGIYRYIRLYINKSQSTYPIVYEIKIYGALPEPEPPRIISSTPQSGAVYYDGEAVTVSATVNDGASGAEYQFYADGTIKQAWSKEAVFKWTAQPGKHNIKIEVKNAKGSDSKQIELYAFRKPISPL